MTSNDEWGRDVEPAGEVSGAAEAARRRLRTRVVSEEVVAAIPEAGEPVAAAPAQSPRRPRTRVFAEAVVAAIPAEGEGAAEGGAGGQTGPGA